MSNELAGTDEQLFTLCAALGVDRGYYNIWGDHRELTRATAVTLLSAFGVDLDEAGSIERALSETEKNRWLRQLPTFAMVQENEKTIAIDVVIDAQYLEHDIDYEIVSDSGAYIRGSISPVDRQELERRTIDSTEKLRQSINLSLTEPLALGYYSLTVSMGGADSEQCVVAIVPNRGVAVPQGQKGPRHWGLSVQLYSLRSDRNWGIGDFTDLADLIDIAADFGAAVVGVNPLHALNLHAPPTPNPYSPTSRHFLNASYLDVESIADYLESGFSLSKDQQARIVSLRTCELIDHAAVIELKFDVLRELFENFRVHHLAVNSPRAREFAAFKQERGERLSLFAIFEASACLQAGGTPGEAPPKPMTFAATDSVAVDAFMVEHGDLVNFFAYLQWQADIQLRRVVERTRRRGMAIGLYVDLAVGCTFGSADIWSQAEMFATGVEIGAPADDFSPDGQSWGTAPLRPDALAKEAYATFVQLLRDNMQYAGAIRIDHVLGLMRQFWVPSDRPPTEGAYVRYPLQELLALTALESKRHRCIVVGEDLGNVPDEIRHALWQWGVLSTRIFYFEKYWEGDHAFKIPEHYPDQALTTVGSHDLPTLRGFWEQRDLDTFASLNRFPSTEFAEDRYQQRRYDRDRILARMHESQVDSTGIDPDKPLTAAATSQLAIWLYSWLAQSPSQILLVQPEDVFGVLEQTNIPGTITEHPNWRHKLPINLADWRDHEPLSELADALRAERPQNANGANPR